MYGASSYLLCLWDLEEQRVGERGGFKVTICRSVLNCGTHTEKTPECRS